MVVERRTLLVAGGAAALGAIAGGAGVSAVMRRAPVARSTPVEPVAFDGWLQRRKPPYYIAHRGAAHVAPEHSLPSYLQALAWGAEAIEISVVKSSDDQLFCCHDLTLDRTTTGSGPAARYRSAELDRIKVNVPRLGPRWRGANMPPLPRLADVLAAVGGRAVLCLEAKDDSAYPLLAAMVQEAGLQNSVMVKLPGTATDRLEMVKAENYPVFAYLGNPEIATAKAIDSLARRLDPVRDALGLPARDARTLLSEDLVRRAVDSGIPTWMVPVHRRYEVAHFARLGVQGIISPDLGYLNGVVAPLRSDTWADGVVSPGELTRDPYRDEAALHWEEAGSIGIDIRNRPSFLTLGQFCPITASSYRVTFNATFDPLPTDTWQHLSIAFGHADDRYYEHRSAQLNGYHAQLRADGTMAIYAHVEGDPNGKLLTVSRPTTPLKRGLWTTLTLDVTPAVLRFSRDDGSYLEAHDARFRGGYLHIGRSGSDGKVKIRDLQIT